MAHKHEEHAGGALDNPGRGPLGRALVNGVPHFDEQSERIVTAEEADSGGGFVAEFCREWAVNQETALGMIAMVEADVLAGAAGAVEQTAQALRQQQDLITRGFLLVQDYVRKQGNPVMAERCMWLLLGFPELAGAADQAGLVKLLNREKATVNKCLLYFQQNLPELPKLPEQRTEEQKDGFAAVQKQIWRRAGQPKAQTKAGRLKRGTAE